MNTSLFRDAEKERTAFLNYAGHVTAVTEPATTGSGKLYATSSTRASRAFRMIISPVQIPSIMEESKVYASFQSESAKHYP